MTRSTQTRIVRPHRNALRPRLDILEERRLLSVLTVNTVDDNTSDTSVLTLRDAITLVNNGGAPTSLGQPTMPAGWAAQIDNSGGGFGTNDTIDFNIPGTGVHTIHRGSELPPITQPVVIDGYRQPGSSRNTLAVGDNAVLTIELDGADASPPGSGLVIAADNSTVQGLVVNDFGSTGISVPSNGVGGPTGVVIQGCFVGTDPSGTVARPNGYVGIDAASVPVLIGTDGSGTNDSGRLNDYAERNIISGNGGYGVRAGTGGAVVAGNYIGTDRTGTVALPNDQLNTGGPRPGIEAGPGSRIGVDGHDADPVAERNVISGNAYDGVDAYSGSVVAGNYIGIDATGLQPLGNAFAGVVAHEGALIGTDGDGVGDEYERNVISGNPNGIFVIGSNNHIAGNYIGTDPTGTYSIGQNGQGVIFYQPGSHDNVPGYDSQEPVVDPAGERNVISGNRAGGVGIVFGAYRNTIAGNFIGTDATGTVGVPNSRAIEIHGGSYNRIGTDSDGVGDDLERNIISGNPNANAGVVFTGDGNDYNVVAGNYIGLDVTGTRALGNDGGVVFGDGTSGIGNRIGVDATSANPPAGRNIITGPGPGIWLKQPAALSQTIIAGNYIGTDKTGRTTTGADGAPLGCGVTIEGAGASGTQIEGNVIGGSGVGVGIDRGATGTLLAGNWIGTNAYGDRIGNGTAVLLGTDTPARDTQVGGPGALGNTIAFNGGVGVAVNLNSGSTGNSIRGNSIHDNALGISVDPSKWPFPVLSAAYAGASTVVMGTLNSTPSSTFTIDFYANPAPDSSGYFEGQTYLGSTTVTTDATGYASIKATSLAPASLGQWITATATLTTYDASNNPIYLDTSEFSQGKQVTKVDTTTTVTASANPSYFGQAVTFTATVAPAVAGIGTPTGTVTFSDGTTPLGTGTLSGGSASFTTSVLSIGTHTITASYGGDATFNATGSTAASTTVPLTETVYPSFLVLNPTANGALTLSGNASIKIPGAVVVDSSSKTAVSAAGNAQVTAAAIDVVGGTQQTGTATFHPAPTTGVASVGDPLGGLSSPSITNLTNFGSVKLSGSSQQTLSPGIYSQISASGSASLTLSPGIYIIEGGGFSVTGSASVSGSGVMIYNAGSNYPSSGGTFGGIALSGTGSFNLTAANSGPYAGILIFQSRQNTRALSFSGTAMGGMTGVIYAQNALLSMSGNASLANPLDVGMLNLSGNVTLTQIAAGSDGTGDTSGIANTLLAGNLSVYINDPSGLFTSDELARIQDAINTWDVLLAPYSVTITEVSDPTQANITIDTSSTSASGSAANGVLGCFNAPNGEITILQGWNWYAGSNPSQIGSGQYDFETTVLHELGHALGLGGSTNPNSPMYETLAAAVTDRTPTTQDLNIPDPPEGADPQMAAGYNVIPSTGFSAPSWTAAAPSSAPNPGTAGLMPLLSAGVSSSGSWSVTRGPWPFAGDQASSPAGSEPSRVIQETDSAPERGRLQTESGRSGLVLDSALDELAADAATWPGQRGAGTEGTGSQAASEEPTGPRLVPPPDAPPPPASPPQRPSHDLPTRPDSWVVPRRTDPVLDSLLDELAADAAGLRTPTAAGTRGLSAPPAAVVANPPLPGDRLAPHDRPEESGGVLARLAVTLLAAGLWGHRARIGGVTRRQARRPHQARTTRSSQAAGLDAAEFADDPDIDNIDG
jgi:hypothetical protein